MWSTAKIILCLMDVFSFFIFSIGLASIRTPLSNPIYFIVDIIFIFTMNMIVFVME